LADAAVANAHAAVSVGFESNQIWVSETNQQVTLNVLRSGDASVAFTVDYQTIGREATPGADFVPQAGTLKFAADETNQIITVPILDDGLVEPDEAFRVELQNPSDGVTTNATSTAWVTIQDNEKPLIFDPTFNPNAYTLGGVSYLLSQPDGKLLLMGYFTNVNGVAKKYFARLNTDGSLDSSFGSSNGISFSGGFQTTPLLQPDGKIILPLAPVFACCEIDIASLTNFSFLTRLNSDGLIDPDFKAPTGFLGATKLALQKDSKILALVWIPSGPRSGAYRILRLDSNGTLDKAFDVTVTSASSVDTLAVQSDGSFLLAGSFYQNSASQKRSLLRYFADGTLDTGFNTRRPDSELVYVNNLAVDAADRILLFGGYVDDNQRATSGIFRLNPDGTSDTSFVWEKSDNYSYGAALIPQLDGKILTAGYVGFRSGPPSRGIARFNSDGSRDQTFLPGVRTYEFLRGDPILIAPMPDGSVVVAEYQGDYQFTRISRFASNSVAVKYVGFSTTNIFANENSTNVTLTVERRGNSFDSISVDYEIGGGSAIADVDYPPLKGRLNFAPLEVTKLVAIPLIDDASPGNDNTLEVRLTRPGDGVLLGRDQIAVVNLEDDDRDGSVDTSFDPKAPASKIWIQADGKILFNFEYLQADDGGGHGSGRFNEDGTLDNTATDNIGRVIVMQPDGKYFTQSSSNIVRRLKDGTLDPTFVGAMLSWTTNGYQWGISASALQPDGKLIFAGAFPDIHSVVVHREILRLNTDGSIDSSFVPEIKGASGIVLQPDGKLLVLSARKDAFSEPNPRIIRLNADGSLDLTFHDGFVSQYPSVYPVSPGLALQADGKIVLFANYYSDPNASFCEFDRLNADGSIDSTFIKAKTSPAKYGRGYVLNVFVQPDQKILIGGEFAGIEGLERRSIARLNADGSPDETFDVDNGRVCLDNCFRWISQFSLQSDGKIFALGLLGEIGGVGRPGIVRLNNHIQLKFIGSERVSDSGIKFKLSSPSALTAVLETSADLKTWSAVSTNTSVGLYLNFDYQPASDASPGFFRVRKLAQ
ncbi:MAG: hypothetical protein HY043_18675, partial [Verrucomicrobia bacterium]|nr:hypothetical protein [Verrucomicrobiota bacterium]